MIDVFLNTSLTILGVIWLNLGLACMRFKKIIFPMPDKNKIDVVGSFNLMWWAIFWPKYLINR